ncbi:nuclear transport factor 2 family protein [Rhodococcus sp. NBC_00297]|uniref:nuclear transport factor 2 family protein n=1 Tax=Rhodococcus sp. NBC_00297 TaxID=2976005 RepID=UPI002E2C379E|nr:nuclear transport factor 2 family protein [Rhodococcus sp. NBC_00297]
MSALRPADVRHEVDNLLGRYAELADARDADAVAELLARADVHFAGTTITGRDAIGRHYGHLFETAPISRHLITNVIVDAQQDRADFRCRYSRWQIDPTAQLLAIGDYAGTCRTGESSYFLASFTVTRSWQAES